MTNITLVAFAAYALLSLLLLVIVLGIAYRLLKKLLSYLFGGAPGGLFGSDAKVRLISLGVATLVFYNVPLALAGTAGSMLYRLLGTAREVLVNGWPNASAPCTNDDKLAQCVSGLLFQFVDALNFGFREAYNSVPEGFPYAGLILYLALWATVAYLLGETPVAQGQPAAGTSPGRRWVSEAYKRLGWNATLNLLFFLILALGSYLSIASIIAIPILQDNAEVSDELSVASLRQRLTGRLKNIDGGFADSAPDGKSLEKVVALTGGAKEPPAGQQTDAAVQQNTSAVAPAPTPTPAPTPDGDGGSDSSGSYGPPTLSAEEMLQRVRDDLSRFQGMRRQMAQTWKDLRSKSEENQHNALESAVTAYEINLKRKGAGEKGRREHMLILAQWFDERVMRLEYILSNCQSALNREDEQMREWAGAAELALGAKTPDARGQIFYRYASATGDVSNEGAGWAEMCRMALPNGEPWSPVEGTSLGYFRLIAQWLVSTELLSLALITGLLGFGLLGSACSTFIREREQRSKDVGTSPGKDAAGKASPQQEGTATPAPAPQPLTGPPETKLLVSDLTGVVIRGMSAAIVVFLAVEGGLAIFASKGSEPNPYVLLLTCFVGAVFSESVWKWARDKYLTFGEDGDDNGDKGKGDDEEHEMEKSPAEEASAKATEAAEAVDAAAKVAHEASAKAAEAAKAEEARRKEEAAAAMAEIAAETPEPEQQATETAAETAAQEPERAVADEGNDGLMSTDESTGDKTDAME
jgi:hypothetical protein